MATASASTAGRAGVRAQAMVDVGAIRPIWAMTGVAGSGILVQRVSA